MFIQIFVVSRDTAGQERYQTITKQYYRRAQVGLMVTRTHAALFEAAPQRRSEQHNPTQPFHDKELSLRPSRESSWCMTSRVNAPSSTSWNGPVMWTRWVWTTVQRMRSDMADRRGSRSDQCSILILTMYLQTCCHRCWRNSFVVIYFWSLREAVS